MSVVNIKILISVKEIFSLETVFTVFMLLYQNSPTNTLDYM
jgi:hypothetical protein